MHKTAEHDQLTASNTEYVDHMNMDDNMSPVSIAKQQGQIPEEQVAHSTPKESQCRATVCSVRRADNQEGNDVAWCVLSKLPYSDHLNPCSLRGK